MRPTSVRFSRTSRSASQGRCGSISSPVHKRVVSTQQAVKKAAIAEQHSEKNTIQAA